jgi:hypothetical protein
MMYKEYVNKGYTKKTAKKKAEASLDVVSSCEDAFTYIYEEIEELIDMSILIKLTRYVRSALLTNIEKIICIMLTIDNKSVKYSELSFKHSTLLAHPTTKF